MAADQLEAIIEVCELNVKSVTIWSDSMIVLHWIKKQSQDLKAFVSNRVALIQEKTKSYIWKHVRSSDNPADLVSRGMKIRDFIKSDLWSQGPKWLSCNESEWPITRIAVSPEMQEEITKECKQKIPQMKVLNIYTGKKDELLYNKFNDWNKIINVTSYVMRVLQKKSFRMSNRYLSISERKKAAEFWIKFEQMKAFKKEFQCLQ